jgi:cell division protein FtsQ
MDGGGRFVGSLDGVRAVAVRLGAAGVRMLARGLQALLESIQRSPRLALELPKLPRRIVRSFTRMGRNFHARGMGAALAAGLFAATGLYGIDRGGHWGAVSAGIASLPDRGAGLLGFGVRAITIEGQHGLTDAEILAALGVTESHSLPFLDVAAARARLIANPLVADVTIRKLYPDRLLVSLVEREAFALWQVGGAVSIIAVDGTVIDELRDRRLADLPLVVGPGAAKEAQAFLARVEKHPAILERLYAGVFVARRRWNLRLRNGVDVMLPEADIEPALAQLETLMARKDVLDRDIVAVDLRFADQIVVRLSEAAAEHLAKADKAKKSKKGAT